MKKRETEGVVRKKNDIKAVNEKNEKEMKGKRSSSAFEKPESCESNLSMRITLNPSFSGGKKRIDRFKLGEVAMPASFKVFHVPVRKTDTIVADFGESAMGRVACIDSGFWWIIFLRAYTKSTGDLTLAETPKCQKGMRLILIVELPEDSIGADLLMFCWNVTLAFPLTLITIIKKNKTAKHTGGKKRIDRFKLGEVAMPASFKVFHVPVRKTDTIVADFGESAMGRVACIDSGFWWIIFLRAYTKSTGDLTLAETPKCQKGMRLILSLCLSEGFDTFPTLLCADCCSMID
ncbi:hypothetical protein LguiB_018205 [Lonicera macranthoides]